MKKYIGKIVGWTIYVIFLAAVVASFVFSKYIFGEGSIFDNVISDNEVLNYLYNVGVRAAVRTIQVIVIAIAIFLVLKLIAHITFKSKKAATVSKLLLSFVKWAIAIAAVFIILSVWGASAVIIAASAGILALIIGLGSQSLVADILAGIFIVFEGDFQVGDIVIIDGWRGEVKIIGIRTTKLMDFGGNIKVINNSDIRSLINQTQELSVAKCYVGTCYGDRIEKIEQVIADNIDKIKEKIPGIVEGPFYKGVAELADSSVNLLFVAKCKESDIYQVQRDLNRQIKIMFDDNGIGIPFPQVTVSYEENNDKKVSKKVKKEAEEFVDEQKELSKDVDIKKINIYIWPKT